MVQPGRVSLTPTSLPTRPGRATGLPVVFDGSGGAGAQELSRSQRQDMTRIEGEIRELDRKSGALMPLLTDPEVDPHAKWAISRQLGELEQRREELQGVVRTLAIEARETTDKLAAPVRQAG